MTISDCESKQEFLEEYELFLHSVYWEGKPLVIFGAGYSAEQLLTNFFPVSDVAFVVDNAAAKQGGKLCGVNIVSPQILADKPDDYAVLIGSTDYQAEIFEQLCEMKVKTICRITSVILNFTKHIRIDQFILPNGTYVDTFMRIRRWMSVLKGHQEQINEVRSWLCDDHSVEVYSACIRNKKYNYGSWYDLWEQSERQYFPKGLFTFGDNECFIDAGCYNGNDTFEFIKRVNGNFSKCFMFEPDPVSFSSLSEKVKRRGELADKLLVYKSGLSNENKQAKFRSQGIGCSALSEDGETEIELVALDDIVKDDKVTFIKMDIEGEEMNALRGAKEVITRDKPKLAICIYHRLSDYWEIPAFIKQLVPEYRLFVRHHYFTNAETVLYATL